jgi:hypothetical protein
MVQSAIITLMESVKSTKPTTSMNLARKLRGRNPRKGQRRDARFPAEAVRRLDVHRGFRPEATQIGHPAYPLGLRAASA